MIINLPIKLEEAEGRTIITLSNQKMFLGIFPLPATYDTRYMAVEEIVKDYWTWLELPSMTIVPDSLSFQLDAWKKYGIKDLY